MNIKNRYIFNQMAVAKGWLIKTFLLLLLLFVACGEPDDMFGTIHGDDEEIELTINTLLPDGGISTRTAPTENITSITALAFDRNHELIKVQTSEVVQSTTTNTTGTFKVTVPQRTRRIHFIAKNNGEFTEITESDYGKTDVGLLVNRISSIQNSQDADGISNALHYWQMLDFDSAEDLKDLSDELQALDKKTDDGYQLPLIRNMAKITLNLQNGMTGHIAGILNYNTTGTIVPYLKDGNNYTFGYQTKTNHELPSTFVITSDVSNCSELGTVHYLFEEYDDVGDLIYVMCYIDNDGESGNEDTGHFYKVALVKPTFTGVEDKYYYVIRNQAYNINIVGKLDVTLGKTDYSDAVQNGKPINDSEKEQVHLDFEPDEVYMYIGESGTVTVKIPEGITDLQIGFPSERFDADGVIAKNTAGNNLENSIKTNGNIHISTYDVTGLSEIVLSMNLKSSIQDAISGMELQFIGSGEDKIVNDKLVVHVLKRDALNVTPTAVEIPRTKRNSFSVNVIIPSFDNYDGAYELTVNDKDKKYNITAPGTLVLQDTVYNVEKGQTYTFAFELREDGTAGDKHTIDFHLDTDYHDYDATTIVTLIDNVVHDQDYEIWVDVDNSKWTGIENSVEFFGYETTVDNGFDKNTTPPTGFRTDFYDTGANAHKQQAMVMGSDDSFTFTITGTEPRYLTLLVAADDGTSPSINLTGNLTNGKSWTTANSDDDESVPSNYNFGDGEIGSAGRLIRYELAPGTYTLKGSDATYLLYYMRLTRTKPEMTDVAQPLITDYELSWSGGAYADSIGKGLLKLSNTKYIIDQDNLTHTIAFNSYDNSLGTSLNLSTFSLNNVNLQVETNRYSFSSNDSNNYTPETHTSQYSNLTNNLNTYNGGNYELSGTINNPNYKYSDFYEKLHLEPVTYEVKNPIMPLLYNSMEAQRDPVKEFKSTDEAWAIGFGMPLTMPTSVVGTRIDIDIPNWTKYSGEGSDTGLGVHIEDSDSYYLLTQDDVNNENKIHPRPEWVYKIRWDANSVSANQKIVPELENTDANNNNDIYFSYKGTIAKRVEIPTPYTVVDNPLNISLDFYADVDGNGTIDNNGNNFNNLLLGTSRVYLKATLSGNVPSSGTVQLQGEFNSPYQWENANGAIHWDFSKNGVDKYSDDKDDIRYYGNDHNGTGLEFDIVTGKTEYLIDWVFVTGGKYSGSGDIQFTYRLSNNQGYTVTGDVGDNSPTFAFVNEPISNGQIQVATNGQSGTTASIPLYYGQNSSEEFTVDVTIPAGVTQLNIQADDFNVSRVNGNNIDTSKSITTTGGETMRLKFTLTNGSHTDKNSTITFSGNNNVSSATVNVDLSPRASESSGVTTIWNGWAQLNWADGINYLSTGYQIPVGSVVTLNFTTTTTGGSIKLHDVNGGANIIALPGRDYGNNDNLGIIPVNSGDTSFSFNVTNDIKVNYQNIDGYLNGLKINGENVILTSIVVSTSGSSPTETVLINDNFNNNTKPDWCDSGGGTTNFENGTLSFTATGTGANDYDNQIRFTGLSIVNGATYKLTFKIKSNVSDSEGLDIAFDDPSDNYSWCGAFSNKSLKLNASGNFTEVTLTATATKTINNARLFINLGHLGACTIEIDDLKLERTN